MTATPARSTAATTRRFNAVISRLNRILPLLGQGKGHQVWTPGKLQKEEGSVMVRGGH